MNAPVTSFPGLDSRRAAAARCSASNVLRWVGLSELADHRTDEMVVATRRVRAESPLIHEGQPFEHLYFVGAGSFKCVQNDVEGYEQVLGFAFHGDVLGLDGMSRTRYPTGAVALEDSMVAVIPFRELIEQSHHVPALEHLLHHAAGVELMHRGDTQYLMSAASAEVRVARFLLHFAQRQSALGLSNRRLRLRMTRRDIASCLGVAHETVSRALSALVLHGCITVLHRDIEITDAVALYELQRVTRGAPRGRRISEGQAIAA